MLISRLLQVCCNARGVPEGAAGAVGIGRGDGTDRRDVCVPPSLPSPGVNRAERRAGELDRQREKGKPGPKLQFRFHGGYLIQRPRSTTWPKRMYRRIYERPTAKFYDEIELHDQLFRIVAAPSSRV